jgi:hypothetical protein
LIWMIPATASVEVDRFPTTWIDDEIGILHSIVS